MRRALLFVMLAGCGSEPTMVAMTVRMDAQYRDQIAKISAFAMGQWRTDNKQLTCTNLRHRNIAPTDSLVDLLARDDVDVEPTGEVALLLSNVPEGPDLVVYVEALDATDAVKANGCEQPVKVEAGKTTVQEVEIYAVVP